MTAAIAALLVWGVAPAEANQAAELAHRSMAEYDAGLFSDALRDAQAAYLKDPKPGLLFNIAQVHRAMHHWEQAEFNYRRYLAEKRDAPNRAAVEQLIAEMQQKEKEEAAEKAAPPAVAPVIVEAPPPEPKPAPASAVTAPVAPPHHSHAISISLGAAGIVMLGLMAAAIVEVAAYNGTYGSGATKGQQYDASQYNLANVSQYGDFFAGALGVAGLTGAALTW